MAIFHFKIEHFARNLRLNRRIESFPEENTHIDYTLVIKLAQ